VRFRSGKELKGLTPDCDPGHRAFTVFLDGDRYVERVIVFYRKDLEVFFEGDPSP
jgi:hypothetical protein